MFDQIETDGQGVTPRPSHLTGSNGCTRLPVEASPLPSESPSQIDSASSATGLKKAQIWPLSASDLMASLLH